MNHLEMATKNRTDENEAIIYSVTALVEKLGHIEQNLFDNTRYLKTIAEQLEKINNKIGDVGISSGWWDITDQEDK